MSEPSTPGTPAGWYPVGEGTLRYWDGLAWTDHVAPAPAAEPAAPAPPPAPSVPANPASPAAPVAPVAAQPVRADPRNESAGVAQGLQMKERNPLAAWLLLPIITLGIYHLVWYYKIHKEMAEFDRRRETPVAGPMLVLLFLGWTIVAPAISYHNAGARVRDRQVAAGVTGSCSPTLAWALMFLFGFNTYYLQTELNKAIAANPGVAEGTPVALRA